MKRKEKDKYGNVTFGEATELLIDIIEQIVILDLVKKEGKEPGAYKKKLERMYDGQGTYSKFATASKGSPQWYFSLFFKTILEDKYNISPLAMIIVDSFTWQFFNALKCITPFEKPKKETALLLVRKQLFNFIYYLVRGNILSNDKAINISRDSIKEFLADNYDSIFSDIEDDFTNTGKNFRSEIKNYWEEKYEDYPKLFKMASLEEVLDELFNDNGIFYKELKDSYGSNINDLKTEKPKLYGLLSSDEKVDNFLQLFKEAVEEFISNDFDTLKIIIEEIPKSKIKYPYFYDYNKSKKPSFNLDEDIFNWRRGKSEKDNKGVYNPTWKTLEPILDFLQKNNETEFVHRLIGHYFLKNAQSAMENILGISDKEHEKIITDIKTMINENKKPEEFYVENDFKFLEQIKLIWMCLVYQCQENFDLLKSNEIIKAIETKCNNSCSFKKFLSPWLNARAKIFETGGTLKENKEVQDAIIKGYKKAYDEGLAYAGEYLGQFLLEAIIINGFCNPRQVKNTNDYYGYGYALEIFGPEKQNLLDLIKETSNLQMELVNILYSDFNSIGKIVSRNFSSLHSIIELKNEAILKNNKGLELEKTGDLELAIQYFTEALILNPVYVNAYSNRGNVYSKKGEQSTENALADFNMALLLDPQHENTLFNRGSLYLERGQYEEAINDFTNVIDINPEASDAYLGRRNCYKYLGKFDFAKQDYSKAIEINPLYVQGILN